MAVIIALIFLLIGFLLSKHFALISALLIFVGIIILLSSWIHRVSIKHAVKCPNCGAKYSSKLPISIKQHNGIYRCDHCGTIIHVDAVR